MRETSKETTCTHRAAHFDQPHTWWIETLLKSALTCSGLEQWLGNSSRTAVQEHSAPQCESQWKADEAKWGGLGYPTGWKKRIEYSFMCCPCPAASHWGSRIWCHQAYPWHWHLTQPKWASNLYSAKIMVQCTAQEALGATLLDGALRQPLS